MRPLPRHRLPHAAAGYHSIAKRFFDGAGFEHVALLTADGALEAAPAMGCADIILDLVSTGAPGTCARVRACTCAHECARACSCVRVCACVLVHACVRDGLLGGLVSALCAPPPSLSLSPTSLCLLTHTHSLPLSLLTHCAAAQA